MGCCRTIPSSGAVPVGCRPRFSDHLSRALCSPPSPKPTQAESVRLGETWLLACRRSRVTALGRPSAIPLRPILLLLSGTLPALGGNALSTGPDLVEGLTFSHLRAIHGHASRRTEVLHGWSAGVPRRISAWCHPLGPHRIACACAVLRPARAVAACWATVGGFASIQHATRSCGTIRFLHALRPASFGGDWPA